MASSSIILYCLTFFPSFILSAILTPAARTAALQFKILDHPTSAIKTHKEPVPYLGGVAIFIAFTFSLFFIRVLTDFPTGTLRSLRGIVLGGAVVFIMGMVDDIKPGGLSYKSKLTIQICAAMVVMFFGVHIKFIKPDWLAYLLSIFWIVGVTNAFNIMDIMDGLSSGVAIVAALAFLFISLPTEEIYVNFFATALAGASIGFFPYNISKKWRIFMGDSGSLFLGFISASLALGADYGKASRFAVLAPLLILAPPIFDTIFVSYLRMRRGQSPFLGSKDHFPLRLEKLGWKRPSILIFCLGLTTFCTLGATILTCTNDTWSLATLGLYALLLILFINYLLRTDHL